MIVKGHGCSSKGLMDFWSRTCLFMCTMGSRLGLPITCVGKPLEGGVQRIPSWIFGTPT